MTCGRLTDQVICCVIFAVSVSLAVPALSARLTITESHAEAGHTGGNPMDGTTEGSVAASCPAAPSSSDDQWPRLATGPCGNSRAHRGQGRG